jgi:hypothetical protein
LCSMAADGDVTSVMYGPSRRAQPRPCTGPRERRRRARRRPLSYFGVRFLPSACLIKPRARCASGGYKIAGEQTVPGETRPGASYAAPLAQRTIQAWYVPARREAEVTSPSTASCATLLSMLAHQFTPHRIFSLSLRFD